MSARQPRFEICRGDDYDSNPWWARYRAANGRIVWVTENYARREGAENALASLAKAMWGSASELVPDQHDGLGSYLFHEPSGCTIEVREVDER